MRKPNRLPGRLRACSLLLTHEGAELMAQAADEIESKDEMIAKLEADLEALTVDPCLFDSEEVYFGCTVQVLKNSLTGDVSIGFWPPGQGEV